MHENIQFGRLVAAKSGGNSFLSNFYQTIGRSINK